MVMSGFTNSDFPVFMYLFMCVCTYFLGQPLSRTYSAPDTMQSIQNSKSLFERDLYSYDLTVWEEQAWSKLSTRNIPGLATVWVEHNEIRRERREPTKA